MNVKGIAFCLAAAMTVMSLAGCSNNNAAKTNGQLGEITTSDSYPIDTDVTLTYYVTMDSNVSDVVSSMNETEFAKELIKKTGINVEFDHPAIGQEQESYNLMFASADYPDIVEYRWGNYSGGLSRAVEDGIVLPLDDIVEKVSPNFKKLMSDNEIVRKGAAVNGKICMYPFYQGDEILATYAGVMMRKDLLDQLNLDVPETIDEWETALRGFKDLVEVPFTANLIIGALTNSNLLVGAYGIGAGMYVDDGKVKYGPYEENFRPFVEKMASWYQEGLLDSEFSLADNNRITSLVINGQIGAVYGANGSSFGTWLKPFREKNPGAELVPVPYPVLNKGDKPEFGQKSSRVNGTGAVITTNCKNVEIAARLLDYGYSEEGQKLYNFGIEGESYEMKDGVPTYTPMITDAESLSGSSMGTMLSKYCRASTSGPFVQSKDYILQWYRDDVQKEALKLWSDTKASEHILPTNLAFSAEDSAKISKMMSDITTAVDEDVLKMMLGTKPLSEYDAYVEKLKSMGIEEVLELYQKAYDEYIKQ